LQSAPLYKNNPNNLFIIKDYVVDTNASTTQDSTSYYFDCANFTGFINAFKLFFEHLMSPMLEVIIQYYDMRVNN